MKGFISKSRSPHFNLALEEYLFNTCHEEDLLMLYINDPAVIVGRNQNVFEEVYVKKAQADRVPIVRRMTGGGAVFHDNGNLNYCFMTDYKDGSFGSYDDFLQPVIKLLQDAGIPAEKRNNSDLACGGCKISGNAQMVRKGRILHHGTLLFDADLDRLHRYLRQDSGHCQSKSVKSVRSRVTNLSDYGAASPEAFAEDFLRSFCGSRVGMDFSEKDMETVLDLQRDKYETWWWNFGRSPAFTVEDRIHFRGRSLAVQSRVNGGLIKEVSLAAVLTGPELCDAEEKEIQQLFGMLTGRQYREDAAAEIFEEGDHDGTDLYAQAQ